MYYQETKRNVWLFQRGIDLLTVSETSTHHLHPPEGRLAPISPVVLWRAVRAAVLVAVVPAEPDPEVSIRRPQLRDELLHHLLLRFRLDAEQLPTVSSAGQICLNEVQPPPELGEVGQLVARFTFPGLALSLACNQNKSLPY